MESKVISLIRKAYHDHGVKIFVLTLGYKDEKKANSEVSDYARALDNLAYELDILIFISTGNLDISHLAENNGACGSCIKVIICVYDYWRQRRIIANTGIDYTNDGKFFIMI